jgi:hypothetical protein
MVHAILSIAIATAGCCLLLSCMLARCPSLTFPSLPFHSFLSAFPQQLAMDAL